MGLTGGYSGGACVPSEAGEGASLGGIKVSIIWGGGNVPNLAGYKSVNLGGVEMCQLLRDELNKLPGRCGTAGSCSPEPSHSRR